MISIYAKEMIECHLQGSESLAPTLIPAGWLTSHTSEAELAAHVLTPPLGEVSSFCIEKEEILEMDHSQSPPQWDV